jgi:hypothetical protein
MAHPGGRPTKYTPEVIQKIDEYLETVGKGQMKLPTRFGFAEYIGVNEDTLVEWEHAVIPPTEEQMRDSKFDIREHYRTHLKYPEYSAAIKRIDSFQKEQLMDDGLYGGKEVNASMAIFLLKANHGLVETEKRIIAGDKEEPLIIVQDANTSITVADEGLER